MLKNVCNMLKLVMVGLIAVVALSVHFAQSPSGKKVSPRLSTQTPKTNPSASTKQNSSPAQSLGLLAALFALPLTIAGYQMPAAGAQTSSFLKGDRFLYFPLFSLRKF